MARNLFIGNDSHFDHTVDTLSNVLTIGGSTLNGGLIGLQQGTAEALSQISGKFITRKMLENPDQLSKIMEDARKERWDSFQQAREAERETEMFERMLEVQQRINAAQKRKAELKKELLKLQEEAKEENQE